jgi:GH15 family glucan-1,4-alpha-glucosidase
MVEFRPSRPAHRCIEDYALIGNTYTAALVRRNGSIEWLCLPRLDDGACFASLLGSSRNGRWLLSPVGAATRSRRYLPGTLILETAFTTDSGRVTITDFMPPPQQEGEIDVVRIVRGERGQVPMRMEFVLRFDYGRVVPWVRRRPNGLHAVAGPDAVLLQTPAPLRGENLRTVSEFIVSAGDSVGFVLTWHASHSPEPGYRDASKLLEETVSWARGWCGQCSFSIDKGTDCPPEWEAAVQRSLLTLKALTHRPTGGIAAAATTSLPEQIGGVRNWDYRYCWIRDSTFTLYALLSSGYHAEAHAWREWLLRSAAGEPSQLQIMYGLAGERRLPELTLDWLAGFEHSAPVRIGNAAHSQFQLDVYGELMDTLHVARIASLDASPEAWRVQRVLMRFLETAWSQPDDGLWEIRGPRRHFTHSKVMAWVALDRVIASAEQFQLAGPLDRWRSLRTHIHQEICELGYDRERNTFVQTYGGSELDAALLMIPLTGFLPPRDPRVIGTVEAIQRDLMADGLVMRYRTSPDIDGLPPGEGTFIACSFWLADCLALMGRQHEAIEMFERLLDIRNDVGLLAEEYDPVNRRQLGNFPQAFSHVGLINTAHNLATTRGPAEKRRGE